MYHLTFRVETQRIYLHKTHTETCNIYTDFTRKAFELQSHLILLEGIITVRSLYPKSRLDATGGALNE